MGRQRSLEAVEGNRRNQFPRNYVEKELEGAVAIIYEQSRSAQLVQGKSVISFFNVVGNFANWNLLDLFYNLKIYFILFVKKVQKVSNIFKID